MKNLYTKEHWKKAFTLAEVLITLGIIGVVAAITMPTLIQNHKKQVYVNQLKKSVSTLEQGLQKIMADEEVTDIEDTELFYRNREDAYHGECALDNISISDPACKIFFDGFLKYFNGEIKPNNSKYTIHALNGDTPDTGFIQTSDHLIFLNDGSIIYFYNILMPGQYSGYFEIDINGLNGPNKYGRDIFQFEMTSLGKLIPLFSENSHWINTKWNTDPTLCGTPGKTDAEKIADGSGCAARIIANGWKMDY